jgi:hypothetical protein
MYGIEHSFLAIGWRLADWQTVGARKPRPNCWTTFRVRCLLPGTWRIQMAPMSPSQSAMDRLGDASKIAHALLRETMSTHNDGASGYVRYFGAVAGDPKKAYYSYDLGDWHIIVLNSECEAVGGCGAGSAQEQWLRHDLKDHPAKCTLTYWHKPLFSSGAAHGNAPEMKPVWDALYSADADIVIGGHDHDYERFAPQDPTGKLDLQRGIREFVVGTGGKNSHRSFASPKPNSEVRQADTFGVLKLTLHPTSYDWEFEPEAGKTFTDSGSKTCH